MTQPIPQPFAKPEEPSPAEKRRAKGKGCFVLVLVAGALLLMNYGERFVFYHAAAYTTITLGALIVLTPLVLYHMSRTPTVVSSLAQKYPTGWVRKGIMMPLAAAAMVGLLFAAPLGWLFAVAAWSGGAVQPMRATAIEVGPYARSKNCDQSATLRFASVEKKTCLDGLYPPSAMREGQQFDVGTTVFPFGFLIVSIAPADREVSVGGQ